MLVRDKAKGQVFLSFSAEEDRDLPSGLRRSFEESRVLDLSFKNYSQDLDGVHSFFESYRFSTDWFSDKEALFLYIFETYGLRDKEDMRVLEIGSWEGRSSLFMLYFLPDMHMVCVDSWSASHEYTDDEGDKDKIFVSAAESAFDFNISGFLDRVTKYKGTSLSYFSDVSDDIAFDLVYIDGSHYCDNVLLDALWGFSLLRVGGVMIFDDYIWMSFVRDCDNPYYAINSFLRLKDGLYRFVYVGRQVAIEKTSDSGVVSGLGSN